MSFPTPFQFSMNTDRMKPKPWLGKGNPKIAEVKRDGYRTTIVIGTDGQISAFQGVADCVWHKIKHTAGVPKDLPFETILDGELESPGQSASRVSTAIAEGKPLDFTCFAIPFYAGMDTRNRTLAWRDRISAQHGLKVPEQVPIDKACRELALEMKVEGFVLKQAHYRDWWKMKFPETVDVVITTAFRGDGKFAGRWGSLQASVYRNGRLFTVANVAKGEDAEWRDKPLHELVGRVAEIRHEGIQAHERLKFSAFIRWRDDKLPEQCLFEQITKKA